jgi:trigger factor
MQVKKIKSENLVRHFEVVVPAGDIEGHLAMRVSELSKNMKVQGFRPGKVPPSLVIKRYGSSIIGEVLDKVIANSSSQVIKDNNLKPALQPTVQITSYLQGGDLKYNLLLEILPEIEPVPVKDKEIIKYVVKVTEEKLEEDLLELLKDFKNTQKVESDRLSQAEDTLILDFDGKIKGAKIPGGSGKNYKLTLGSNTFIPGFEDQLLGKKSGENVKVSVKFPENYHETTLAGKDADFDVTIHEIREPAPLKLDDNLAINLGFPDAAALKESIKTRLEAQYEELSRTRLKRSLLDLLYQLHAFEIPDGMVQMEFKNIWEQLLEEIKKDETRESPDLSTEEEVELKEEYLKIAERRVRLGLLLSEIGKRENVVVTNNEINSSLVDIQKRFPGQEKDIASFYRKHPEALSAIRAPIFEEKVVDVLLASMKITTEEVSEEKLLEEINSPLIDDEEVKVEKTKKVAAKKETPSETKEKDTVNPEEKKKTKAKKV